MTYKKYIIPGAAIALAVALLAFALLGGKEEDQPVVITPVDPTPSPAPLEPVIPTPDPVPTPDPDPQPTKYKRPAMGSGLLWSLEVARLAPLDPNRDIHGFEFQLVEDKDGYEVRPGLGDCDKITGIRLYGDRIEIWLDADYDLVYANTIGAFAVINQPEGTERAQETSEQWELQLGQPGQEHCITVKFSKTYPASTIFNLRVAYGKLD